MCVRKTGHYYVKYIYGCCSNVNANPHMSLNSQQRLFQSSSNRHSSSQIYRGRPGQLLAGNVKGFIRPVVLNLTGSRFIARYSTGKSSVTDEILKSKIAEDKQQSEKQDDSSQQEEPKKEGEKKKKERWWSGQKNAWKVGMLSLGVSAVCIGSIIIQTWGPPLIDEDGVEVIDEFTHLSKWEGYVKRSWAGCRLYKKTIIEPYSKKLLPEPLQYPYHQPPYTLVLEMTGVLVHPDWTFMTGWRFKKRPAVDQFLEHLVVGTGGPPPFEIVIYTRESGFTGLAVVEGLDPKGFIMYKLFRDATRYVDGDHVKDLDCLNRDPSKVIIVDWDQKAVRLQPRNAVLLPRWSGDDNDRRLMDLASFLSTIAMSDVEDVRTVLDHYNQFDDPVEAFKENQRRLQEQHEIQAKASLEKKENKSLVGSWASGLTGRRK